MPASVMVDEERGLQCPGLGEKGVLHGSVDQMSVGVAGTRLSQPQNVIRTLLAPCQKHDSKVGTRVTFSLSFPPRNQTILIGFIIKQLRADALLCLRIE